MRCHANAIVPDIPDLAREIAEEEAKIDAAAGRAGSERQAGFKFDYTAEQWAEIAKSFEPLQPQEQVIERARVLLVWSAREYFLAAVNGPRHEMRKKLQSGHWAKVQSHADALMSQLRLLARDELGNVPPSIANFKMENAFKEALPMLLYLSVWARSRVVELGELIDDGFPKVSAKAYYQCRVLRLWTQMGGKLGISRHPVSGKTKGPLARYFSAVTQPVHGGSPESLHAIVKRHRCHEQALERWRMEMFIANDGVA
jgi:hypothetical protein